MSVEFFNTLPHPIKIYDTSFTVTRKFEPATEKFLDVLETEDCRSGPIGTQSLRVIRAWNLDRLITPNTYIITTREIVILAGDPMFVYPAGSVWNITREPNGYTHFASFVSQRHAVPVVQGLVPVARGNLHPAMGLATR